MFTLNAGLPGTAIGTMHLFSKRDVNEIYTYDVHPPTHSTRQTPTQARRNTVTRNTPAKSTHARKSAVPHAGSLCPPMVLGPILYSRVCAQTASEVVSDVCKLAAHAAGEHAARPPLLSEHLDAAALHVVVHGVRPRAHLLRRARVATSAGRRPCCLLGDELRGVPSGGRLDRLLESAPAGGVRGRRGGGCGWWWHHMSQHVYV